MSYSSDYTITSLSSSIEQRTFKNGATRAPFSLAANGRIGLRGGCIPYIVFGSGQVPSYPKQSDCAGPAPGPPGLPINITPGYGQGINIPKQGPEVGGGSILVTAGYGQGINIPKQGPAITGGAILIVAGYGQGINIPKQGPVITG
jgi:hypothetical protein